jgi:phosphoribosylaminoimidazolecarboxamide formyltransferase/IMP cyclohydrolase
VSDTHRPIERAILSAYNKEGLEAIGRQLHQQGIEIYSTGGTQAFLENLGIPVVPVEKLTQMPSILGGRVKTLHPRVFGGILARREHEQDRSELDRYDISAIDLVLVDLYPFEETLAETDAHEAIIEKIDIGGVALIRAAAKNYQDVLVIPSRRFYDQLRPLLEAGGSALADRRRMAAHALSLTSAYDATIARYLNPAQEVVALSEPLRHPEKPLRYGENPHQKGYFYGKMDDMLEIVQGKALSYNNIVDVDAATALIDEFDTPATAVIKHTNPCGLAVGDRTPLALWQRALAGDPVSAFGGIIATNRPVDADLAEALLDHFFEVLIAPAFSEQALELFASKRKRILLRQKEPNRGALRYRSALNGMLAQDNDLSAEKFEQMQVVTERAPGPAQQRDLEVALIAVKHAKSNAIVLVKGEQLIGVGVGQTSRVDAARHAVEKARHFGFSLEEAVMASDAFFPFADSIAQVQPYGVTAVVQPGGSIRDQESIDFCNTHQMAMATTGVRHFKH